MTVSVSVCMSLPLNLLAFEPYGLVKKYLLAVSLFIFSLFI